MPPNLNLPSNDQLSRKSIPLPKLTLEEHAFRQLEELILNGEISPGQIMTVQALSNVFGVSTMPIRAALKRMTDANVLTVISSRSVGIPNLTLERLEDLTRVRLIMEGTAAAWAVTQITNEELEQLEILLQSMLANTREGDVKGFLRSNREFHFAIYRASGSPTAVEFIEKLWLRAAPYFHHLYQLDSYRKANIEHESILTGLKEGDMEAVSRGIRADIESGHQLLRAILQQ